MTLIAITVKGGFSMVLSDLLFSTEDKKSVQLPLNKFEVDKLLPETLIYWPYALAQKLYVIKDNVCIALAGNLREMAEFVKELKIRCSYKDIVDRNYIIDFLDEYDFKNLFKESNFILTVWDSREEEDLYNVSVLSMPGKELPTTETKVNGKVSALGSGQKGFFEMLNKGNYVSSDSSTSANEVLRITISLIARLLAIEKVSLATTEDAWGGCYEMAYFTNKSFKKVDNIAYLINYGEFDEKGKIQVVNPKTIIYTKYIGDILTIIAIELIDKKGLIEGDFIRFNYSFGEYKASVDLVHTIEKKEYNEDFSNHDFSFRTKFLGIGYGLSTVSNQIINLSMCCVREGLFIEFKQNGDVEIILSNIYWNEAIQGAERSYISQRLV